MTMLKSMSARILTFVSILAIVTACAGTGNQQSAGEFVDDTVVTTRIKTALVQDKTVDAVDIKVKTFKGVVQLSGFADSFSEKDKAVRIASSVDGVKRVEDDIRIKPAD